MFRRYKISISVKEDAAQLADNIPKEFGCSISEPSNWIQRGTTTERGLTVLNGKGTEIKSFIFKHQPFFNPDTERTLKEENEIETFVYESLAEHYSLETGQVKIVVKKDTKV